MNMAFRDIFVAFILLAAFSCEKPKGSNALSDTSISTSEGESTSPKADVEGSVCDSLIENIDKNKLKSIAERFTTSGILESKEVKEYNYSEEGALGHYNLFYERDSKIHYLGELVVLIEVDPNNWLKFSNQEKMLSITLEDSGFSISEHLSVGKSLSQVSTYLTSLNRVSDNVYQYESDCEKLTLQVNSNNIVTNIKLKRK